MAAQYVGLVSLEWIWMHVDRQIRLNTLYVEGEIFESREKKLQIKKNWIHVDGAWGIRLEEFLLGFGLEIC